MCSQSFILSFIRTFVRRLSDSSCALCNFVKYERPRFETCYGSIRVRMGPWIRGYSLGRADDIDGVAPSLRAVGQALGHADGLVVVQAEKRRSVPSDVLASLLGRWHDGGGPTESNDADADVDASGTERAGIQKRTKESAISEEELGKRGALAISVRVCESARWMGMGMRFR